jgi:carbonic anhydrase
MADQAQQSPLWIITSDTQHVPTLAALSFDYKTVNARLHGHNLVLARDAGLFVEFEGMRCPLRKLHFHAPSEHRIDGKIADLELHLVHEIPEYDPERRSSAFVVVGVMLDVSAPNDAQVDGEAPAMHHWLAACFADAKCEGTGETYRVDPSSFLPKDLAYFRYEGSLTTAPFAELVSWVFLRDRGSVGAARRPEPELSRIGQALNRRFVLRSFA